MAEQLSTAEEPKVVKPSQPNGLNNSLSKQTDQQFGKVKHLLSPRDYQRVFSNPKKYFQTAFVIFCRDNDRGLPRLGLAISKKNLPRAVDRNRIKRLVRESFRKSVQNKAVDVVVLTRNPIINMDNTQVFEQLDTIWQRINKRNW